jgi:hypothetical protein
MATKVSLALLFRDYSDLFCVKVISFNFSYMTCNKDNN